VRLEQLAKLQKFSETQILSFLQDRGVISDNCYELKHAANDLEAHGYIIKHWDEFIKFIQVNKW
jgi:hypothetical protein